LYTDGLLESANSAGEEFGVKRLKEVLQKHGKEPLDAICRTIHESWRGMGRKLTTSRSCSFASYSPSKS